MEINKNNQIERKKFTFEIFKGKELTDGSVKAMSRMGQATLYEGAATYNLYLSTFITDEGRIIYYMLPDNDPNKPYDFVLLTRQNSHKPERKYYWQKVGQAYKHTNNGDPILRLDWDLFKTENIFMRLTPNEELPESNSNLTAA